MSYELQVGDILTDKAKVTRTRVLSRSPTLTWLIDITKRRGILPYSMSTNKLLEQLAAGEYIPFESNGPATTQSAGNVRYADAIFDRLSAVLDRTEALMSEHGRMAAWLFLRESDKRLQYRTFIQMLRDYWLAGGVRCLIVSGRTTNGRPKVDTTTALEMSVEAAIRECRQRCLTLQRSAAPARILPAPGSTLKGKPRKRAAHEGKSRFPVDSVVLLVFKKYFATMKEAAIGRTLRKAYDDMCIEVFSSTDALETKVHAPEDSVPTFKQFKNWYEREVPYKTKRVNQVGIKKFETSEREMLGNEFSSVLNVGQVGSGDATIWNVELRSRYVTREIIGPAVVFRIRCKKSGMLLGISISLEEASWNHFSTAIQNCFEDKVTFCARFGIDISPDEWPIKGLPRTIEADCGESDNTKPNYVCRAIGLGFKNITPGRPDIKPGSESDFNYLQVQMNGDTPGSTVQAWQRRKKEWRVKAALDIDEFTAVLLHLELRKMRTVRPDLVLPADLVKDEVDTSPLSIWRWYKENRGGGLRTVDPIATTLALLNREDARDTGHGILFRGLLYTNGPLVTEHAHARTRRAGRDIVDIGFDPRLVDEIYLFRKDGGVIKCSLNIGLEHQADYLGKTFREVQSLDKERHTNNRRQKKNVRHADLDTRTAILDIIDSASKKTAEAPAASLPAATQKKRMPAARGNEKNAHSPGQALLVQPSFTSQTDAKAVVVPAQAPVPLPQLAISSQNVVPLRQPIKSRTGQSSALAALMSAFPSTKTSKQEDQ